jgi:hypothetical protein
MYQILQNLNSRVVDCGNHKSRYIVISNIFVVSGNFNQKNKKINIPPLFGKMEIFSSAVQMSDILLLLISGNRGYCRINQVRYAA